MYGKNTSKFDHQEACGYRVKVNLVIGYVVKDGDGRYVVGGCSTS